MQQLSVLVVNIGILLMLIAVVLRKRWWYLEMVKKKYEARVASNKMSESDAEFWVRQSRLGVRMFPVILILLLLLSVAFFVLNAVD